jgi:ATP-binding cassette subfamily D (ALD) protein 3
MWKYLKYSPALLLVLFLIQSKKKKVGDVGVNAQFLLELKQILPIAIHKREAVLLSALACILFARTYLDIWFSGFNGLIVKAIVKRDASSFKNLLFGTFAVMMWPMSIVNNSLKLCISALSLSIRDRLTKVILF